MEAQINYYESLGVSFANFVGKWKDISGINGTGGGLFYGVDIEIFADGSTNINFGDGTLWSRIGPNLVGRREPLGSTDCSSGRRRRRGSMRA